MYAAVISAFSTSRTPHAVTRPTVTITESKSKRLSTFKLRLKVQVARRIWGTLKTTPLSAISATLLKLTTFVKLEEEWSKVSPQMNWKLEPCMVSPDLLSNTDIVDGESANTSSHVLIHAQQNQNQIQPLPPVQTEEESTEQPNISESTNSSPLVSNPPLSLK